MIFLNQDFKTIQISATFIDYDQSEMTAYRFLLPKLLTTQTDKFAHKKLFNTHLELLYGAYFKTKVERIGQYHLIQIVLNFPDPNIIGDETLFQNAISTFKDVLFDHESFSVNLFNEEKRLLLEQWDTIKDKKRHYANHQFSRHFYEDDPEGYPLSGTREDIEKLDITQMFAYYKDTFLNNNVYLILSGHLTNDMEKTTYQMLQSLKTQPMDDVVLNFRAYQEEKIMYEATDMQQAHLKIGCHFPIFKNDKNYEAALLLDTILGGYPESKLFKEIREKQGLCYDINSNYHTYKGTLVISLGVDAKNKDKAYKEVKKLILKLQDKGISKNDLSYAKAYLVHQIKMSMDHQSVLMKRALLNHLFKGEKSVVERMSSIESVTLSEVNEVLKKLKLDLSYILYGGHHDQKAI